MIISSTRLRHDYSYFEGMLLVNRRSFTNFEIFGYNSYRYSQRGAVLWVILHYLIGWGGCQRMEPLARMYLWRFYAGGFFGGSKDCWINNIVNICG